MIELCNRCQENLPSHQKESLLADLMPKRPFEHVAADHHDLARVHRVANLGASVVDFDPTVLNVQIRLAPAAVAAFANELVQPDASFLVHVQR